MAQSTGRLVHVQIIGLGNTANFKVLYVNNFINIADKRNLIDAQTNFFLKYSTMFIIFYLLDECAADADCGNINQGKCMDLKTTGYPKKVCYCTAPYFGKHCEKSNVVDDRNEELN